MEMGRGQVFNQNILFEMEFIFLMFIGIGIITLGSDE
jgi:hypothetical protein